MLKSFRQRLGFWGARLMATQAVFPTRLTNRKALSAWMQSLYPIAPGIELIRLGGDTDGGYLVPDDLDGIAACFSPGIGSVSRFERDCAARGMRVFLADKSVDAPALTDDRFVFTKKNVGAFNREDCMTMDAWVNAQLNETSDVMLQMDIEGAEYETILGMSEQLMQRTRILVIEFHGLHLFWSEPFFNTAVRAFEKILTQHTCVHIHPNNCCGSYNDGAIELPRLMEFTFLRNDRIRQNAYANVFPHPLDRDNVAKPTLVLPKCWYRN